MTSYESDRAEQRHLEAIWNSLNQPLHYAVKAIDVRLRVNRAFGRCAVRVQKPTVAPLSADDALLATQLASRGVRRGS